MDLVDIQILRAMGLRHFGPVLQDRQAFAPAAIADRVGIDQKTVRTRLDRMHATGFLVGFDLYPNIRLFGRTEAACWVYGLDPEEKRAAFAALEPLPGLLNGHDFFQGPFCVLFTFRDEPDLESSLTRIGAAVGRPVALFATAAAPRVADDLSPLDWRLMGLLRHDALAPVVDLAPRLGVTTRTVRRRLDRLARAKAYYVFPRLDPSKGEGLVFVSCNVTPADADRAATVRRVRAVLGAHLFLEMDSGRGGYYAVVGVVAPAEAETLHRALMRTEGVVDVGTYILQGAVEYDAWIETAIAARAAAPAAAPDTVTA